jgi:hypothetical protein
MLHRLTTLRQHTTTMPCTAANASISAALAFVVDNTGQHGTDLCTVLFTIMWLSNDSLPLPADTLADIVQQVLSQLSR